MDTPERSNSFPETLLKRTFSDDDEEERTAGSGTDLLSEVTFSTISTGQGDKDDIGLGGGMEGMANPSLQDGLHDLSQSDEHLSRDQVMESCDLVVEDRDDEGVSGDTEKGEGKEERGSSEAGEVDSTYAKYLMERRKESEELRLRSKSTVEIPLNQGQPLQILLGQSLSY